MLEYIYVDMEMALPRDVEGPQFAKVTKHLGDSNGIPIGRQHENHMLYTRVYEV